jgi:hypothetical protein
VIELGAIKHDHQPGTSFRVFLISRNVPSVSAWTDPAAWLLGIMLTAMFREPRVRAAALVATGGLVLFLLGSLAHVAWLARLGLTFLVVGTAMTTAATVFVRGRQRSK